MNEIMTVIVSSFFCILRPLGMFIILPIFSTGVLLSNFIRNSIMIAFTLPIIVENYTFSEKLPSGIFQLTGIVLKEISIGFFIGLSFTILFWAIDAAGQIIDTLRGSTISSIFNPSISDSSSITGVILYQFITVIFVIHGGIQSILDKLYLSYEILPLQADIAFNRALIDFLFSLWDSFIKLMLSFSVPMIIGIFLCDMGFGFLNKTAPQLNVFTLSLPVKSLIAIFILILIIHVFPDFITANIHSDIIDRSLPSMINE